MGEFGTPVKQNNMQKNAKIWILKDLKNNKILNIKNLKRFCERENIDYKRVWSKFKEKNQYEHFLLEDKHENYECRK